MRANAPSRTAEIVALMRATDQRRTPAARTADDPYARHFLGPAMQATLLAWERSGRIGDLLERAAPGLTAFVLARHRYMDDRLIEAVTRLRRPIRQVLLLGAGYDMRVHRFHESLRAARVFEVDHPATARRKDRILTSMEARGLLAGRRASRVTVDFERQSLRERLLHSGFAEGRRTFFIWEGVSMYLPREAVKATLSQIASLGGAGSELVFDAWHLPDRPDIRTTLRRLSANLLHLLGEPLLFSIHPDDVGSFLQPLGFRLLDTADAARLEQLYLHDGRSVYPASFVVHAKLGSSGSKSSTAMP